MQTRVNRPLRQRVSVIITDLDNTLFDWVTIWYEPFKALLDRLSTDSGIPQDALEREAQHVFRRHGTSEYAFLIEELPSLKRKHPGADLTELYEPAIKAYVEARTRVLQPYPGVIETLQTLKDRGCLLVGYTESLAYYSQYRLRKLGLDRILDFIYSPPDHDLPDGLSKENIRRYSLEHYQLRRTIARHTPKGVVKPSMEILLDIVKNLPAAREEVIYVGDSLMKDVQMAQVAGITDVWAKYGTAQDRAEYELLRRVTHWPQADVEKEKRLGERDLDPTYVLDTKFAELLELFEFTSFVDRGPERIKASIDVWEKTIEVQQHFNELELKIRNYAVTVLVASVGASAFAMERGLVLSLWSLNVPLAALVLLAGLLAWVAFYGMDRWWYHMLLIGAVNHGMFLEERLKPVFPELGLTGAIGRASPLRIRKTQVHSSQKINWFYGLIGAAVFMLAVFAMFARPAGTSQDQQKPASRQHAATSVEKSSPTSLGRLTPYSWK